MHGARADVWASGDAYEPYVGRWSRPVAREFLRWLAAAPGGGWLDVGCGTGALTEAILGAAAPARVEGVDPSLPYVLFARRRVRDGPATFLVAGLSGVDLAAHQRFSIPWLYAASLVMAAAALVLGVFAL